MTTYFTEAASAETVNARMTDAADPRLREVMACLVRHLHAFAKEIALTQEEWELGIEFLTRTGQICSGERQEFILLSDVLGFSMLVDAINNRRPEGATENTVFGPFHVAGARNARWAPTSRWTARASPAFTRAGARSARPADRGRARGRVVGQRRRLL